MVYASAWRALLAFVHLEMHASRVRMYPSLLGRASLDSAVNSPQPAGDVAFGQSETLELGVIAPNLIYNSCSAWTCMTVQDK